MIRSVDILVRDGLGRTWLQLRDSAARIAPMCWGFWGGAFDPSDLTIQKCAARELREELSIAANPDDFRQVGERRGSNGQIAPLMLFRAPIEWADIRVREGAGAGRFWRSEISLIPRTKAVEWYLDHPSILLDAR